MSDQKATKRGNARRSMSRVIDDWLRRGGMMFSIVALALLLAIGFFYLASEDREDAESEAIVGAAESVDNAAQSVGDAARKAADKFRPGG